MIQDIQARSAQSNSAQSKKPPMQLLKAQDFIQEVWGQVAMMHLMFVDVRDFLEIHSKSSISSSDVEIAVVNSRHCQKHLREVLDGFTTYNEIDKKNRSRLKVVDQAALELCSDAKKLSLGWVISDLDHLSYKTAIWLRRLSQNDATSANHEGQFANIIRIAEIGDKNTQKIMRSFADFKHNINAENKSDIPVCTYAEINQTVDYLVQRKNFLLNSNISEIVNVWVKMVENVSSVEKLLDQSIVKTVQSEIPGSEILFSSIRFANLAQVFIERNDITNEWNVKPCQY